MKYTLVNNGTKDAMRLQGIGLVLGSPAGSLKRDDKLMWNFGSIYTVDEIIKETSKTITIRTSPIRDTKLSYEQTMNKSRLVCKLV